MCPSDRLKKWKEEKKRKKLWKRVRKREFGRQPRQHHRGEPRTRAILDFLKPLSDTSFVSDSRVNDNVNSGYYVASFGVLDSLSWSDFHMFRSRRDDGWMALVGLRNDA